MKILISLFLTSLLHAETPFSGAILANDSTHGGNGKLEILTNGKMMLIRQPGEGFKRASSLIDLTTDSFTQIQNHNHSYTVIGKIEDWPKIYKLPTDHRLMRHPMQQMKRHEEERTKLKNQPSK